MGYGLEFMEGDDASEDQHSWIGVHGRKTLFESASARLYLDGRRVDVPGGFTLEVHGPKGRKGYHPIMVTLKESVFDSLEAAVADGREATLMHIVDGERTVYRVWKADSLRGRLDCSVVEGTPMIWKQGRRVVG